MPTTIRSQLGGSLLATLASHHSSQAFSWHHQVEMAQVSTQMDVQLGAQVPRIVPSGVGQCRLHPYNAV